jgi:hypothetical protein
MSPPDIQDLYTNTCKSTTYRHYFFRFIELLTIIAKNLVRERSIDFKRTRASDGSDTVEFRLKF